MKWKSVEPDIKISSFDTFLNSYNLQTVLAVIKSPSKYFVVVDKNCWDSMTSHLGSSKNELGGLLVGKIFELNGKDRFLVHLEKIIPSKAFENSPVSLKMNSDIWQQANSELIEMQAVVGWYHSHPNLGVFFSSTDRYNQKASFSSEFHLGLVHDPIRNETALFRGADCEEISLKFFEVI